MAPRARAPADSQRVERPPAREAQGSAGRQRKLAEARQARLGTRAHRLPPVEGQRAAPKAEAQRGAARAPPAAPVPVLEAAAPGKRVRRAVARSAPRDADRPGYEPPALGRLTYVSITLATRSATIPSATRKRRDSSRARFNTTMAYERRS
jgi:hypothetical protein